VASSLLNWPENIPRTPADKREHCKKFQSDIQTTRSDLASEMDLMGVEEWRVEEVSGSGGDPGVVVRWRVDGNEYAAACDYYTTKTDNLRETYHWIKETRMREKRHTSTAADSFAAARLPTGNAPVDQQAPPHVILGVSEGASDDEIREAYRDLVKERHPDVGGSGSEFQAVREAYEELMGGVDG